MICVHMLGWGSNSLLDDLRSGGVEFEERKYPIGTIRNSGEVVEVLKIAIPGLAAVLVAWLNTRPTRKIVITTKNRDIYHVEGRSVKEVEELLDIAESVTALDKKK